MSSLSILVFPYRDGYFANRYGCSVRDTMIIKALCGMHDVEEVVVANRPVAWVERILGKRGSKGTPHFAPKLRYVDTTSRAVQGWRRGRSWTERCYGELYDKAKEVLNRKNRTVVLDFTPIAKIDYMALGYDQVWYDLIDNFSVHHRFSMSERALVREKYEWVRSSAQVVSGVTTQALQQAKFQGQCGQLLVPFTNGLIDYGVEAVSLSVPSRYDFGFIGFITDKFDVEYVEELARGYSVAVYGKILDKGVGKRLSKISGVSLKGEFSERDLPNVMSEFDVGLVTYLPEKNHDGSPLKLYKYLAFGKPVLMSEEYKEDLPESPFVRTIEREVLSCRRHAIRDLVTLAKRGPAIRANVRACLDSSVLVESKLKPIVDHFLNGEIPEASGRHGSDGSTLPGCLTHEA